MLLKPPAEPIPIQEIPIYKNVKLFIKREDLIHPQISGNKYWKLFYNINSYLEKNPENPYIITFGGAFPIILLPFLLQETCPEFLRWE
jgi:1-aminocyclopropane-1-carboxylate deaminase